ncbi:MAG: DUF87 domain-containing protein [Clostridiales bacterium]|nr:DUF87 domain-containing protein [Clostridiales bacterium]
MGGGGQDLDGLLDQGEQLGVIGSPSSTAELTLDILGTAVERKLVGELALFRFRQDSFLHYALGQITEVVLQNRWHEDPSIRSLIRQRGRVDAVSERQDTHLGKMTVSAVFRQHQGQFEPAILGTVPSTGTAIRLVDDAMLEHLLRPYASQIFYLGKVYGSTPKLPLWFKHFDTGPEGAGEAYHVGIFGKTGSGKSVLAKMILTGYARHRKMGILVLDPQGEFSKDLTGRSTGTFALPLKAILDYLGKPSFTLAVRNLVLDDWDLFKEILVESPFFERLSMPRGENRQLAAGVLGEELEKAKVKLAELHTRAAFEKAWEILHRETVQKVFYRTADSRSRFNDMLQQADPNAFYENYWKPVGELFNKERPGTREVKSALRWLLTPNERGVRPVLVVDLSKEQARGLFWNDRIQTLVIRRILKGLTTAAERAYQQKEESLNTLVVMDEAHRLAGRKASDEEEEEDLVRRDLIDAARTTRKYGLGWMFISQTLASLHTEILQQLRIMFFGFGLGLGQEFQSLRLLVGSSDASLRLYQTFRDPHSSFDAGSRRYSFMTIGPVSPLSFAGTPLFLNVFNRVEEFLEANRLKVSVRQLR